jgi:predicted component of type VI protein secretion system
MNLTELAEREEVIKRDLNRIINDRNVSYVHRNAVSRAIDHMRDMSQAINDIRDIANQMKENIDADGS